MRLQGRSELVIKTLMDEKLSKNDEFSFHSQFPPKCFLETNLTLHLTLSMRQSLTNIE